MVEPKTVTNKSDQEPRKIRKEKLPPPLLTNQIHFEDNYYSPPGVEEEPLFTVPQTAHK